MHFHARGRSDCLAGMCYADLRDQSLFVIRMYRCNMFGHFDKSGPPKKAACVVGHRRHMSCCIVSLPHAFGKLSLKRQMSRYAR